MHIEQGKLVLKLIIIVVLPMCLGLYLNAKHTSLAMRVNPLMHRISSLFLLIVFSQVIYVNFDKLSLLSHLTLTAGLLFFTLAFVVGYLFGGPLGENRRALAIMTVTRGGSISMMIAGQAFPHDQAVLVIATVMTALSVVVVVPGSFLIRRMTT